MHLRSVTLKGFKSFPDRTRLEFSPGVSVVVGPNGSGKSNITDAVLWAMGEQSPLAVRGQSMQDVIFAGAHGVASRSEAEVEVVLDNGDATVDLPAGEIAISRKLTRSGDGEYRINGARCRLGDVIEILSDTGLGREMHSVVSQGRVESIVTSKPRDRRMLIEEAAGLGKHRKRRRRAQLKLERTQENLARALDVEREARSRLRPLKRQAEAAELHARLQRQADEAQWELAQDAALGAATTLSEAEAAVAVARADVDAAEQELASVSARRLAAEEALSARAAERERLQGRAYTARSAHERVESRLEAAQAAVAELDERRARREGMVAALEGEAAADTGDDGATERIAGLETQLAGLERDRAQRLAREVAELDAAHAATTGTLAEAETAARAAAAERAEFDRTAEAARAARREVETAAERARREAARIGAELAKVNQVLRTHAGAPGGAAALADGLHADPGFELALAAALGPRLRAAVAEDLRAGTMLLDRAGGRDGAAALVAPAEPEAGAATGDRGPAPGAERLLDHVRHEGAASARRVVAALLADVWVVEDVHAVAAAFRGLAVTLEGRVWSPATGELRQVTSGGEDRVLAERNRRDALIAETEQAARAEQAAQAEVEAAGQVVVGADAAREAADVRARDAARARDDAAEVERRARRALEQRRSAPDDTPAAERRRELEAALAAERRLTERLTREREQRRARISAERSRLAHDVALRPVAERLAAALGAAAGAVGDQAASLRAALDADREAGDRLAAELRAGATAEAAVQTRLKERGEVVTREEVRAQQARDRGEEAAGELRRLAQRLGLDPAPAQTPLEQERRADLAARIERLARRREQLGPVNPLAQDEYKEAIAHVEELERLREDLETAMRELEGLIRDTDRRIKEAFEETFAAAAENFEEVAAQLFPGGRGRLRLVSEHSGPRAVRDGEEAAAEVRDPEDRLRDEDEEADRDQDVPGVEIEITPAGKATKRLSLLSGGEKSMTALAFLFAVFLARPCPFYILDEVEAALDDLNIDRFLTLLGRVSDRAQFIVVTHQKRTMEAADCLYGVSMAGNGVSKVISRRLPPREAEDPAPSAHPTGFAA